ncbi:hypothetical protein HKCCSP123_02030 [Rhodobacterales bacterium HKCCSP123]|nr:hypothetical protein [Rhodobacterales bacterium HKCCSP123]
MPHQSVSAAVAVLCFGFATLAAPAVSAQDLDRYEASFATRASVTYGPYLRFELGGLVPELSDGYWLPPGFGPERRNDPRVNFDLSGENGGLASVALGFDWQTGFRADLALMTTGSIGFSGPCSSTSDATPCDTHADISDGSVRTNAVMANFFYAPFEARGSNSRFQPYVVAGLGAARNEVESWTRVANANNQQAGQPTRVFNSNTQDEFAWSVGLGASWQLTEPGERPILLEVSWRYFDFGEAVGGDVGVPGGQGQGQGPAGVPVRPLTFDLTSQVFTIGIRIPLQRL